MKESEEKPSQSSMKLFYKMSLSVGEIPPLFVQLDLIEHKGTNEYVGWKEKARWIRFEEQAEDVLGRWSKPHVATIPQTALEELKKLLQDGEIVLDVLVTDMKGIADVFANELLGYFKDLESARLFAEIMCLPHHHHHQIKSVRKTASGNNLLKMVSSANLQDLASPKRNADILVNEQATPSSLSTNLPSKSQLKYQYSFTDSFVLDDMSSLTDFKENTKFKKKVHRKSEGASILVAPVDFVDSTKLVFLRLEAAAEMLGLLEIKMRSRFVVLIIGPMQRKNKLYEVGRALSACMADDVCREHFYSAQNKEDILNIIEQFNRNTMVIPPGEWNPTIRIEPPEKFLSKEERAKVKEISELIHAVPDPFAHDHVDPTLKGSKKPFNGIVQDIKRKLKFYASDFTDCLNLQCVATTLYMYLVSLCSLVAFGGMLGKKTGNLMATMECILAGSVCGVAFALFSGQPLNIISATGPMLILEAIIKNLCDQYQVEFLEFRLWIGLWTSLFILLMVMFNLSFLVKFITRFTEDCFATLVAVIFIMDAFKSTIALRNPRSDRSEVANSSWNETTTQAPSLETQLVVAERNVSFYFSVLLFFLTFIVCMSLKGFRNKPFLPSKIREIFSDFAVLIAIVLASFIDHTMQLNTVKLTIPSKFEPTSNRTWIVPLFSGNNSIYTIPLAIVPALIATILIFMDQQITAVIINRKEFKLKKSNGYHLDLFIVGITITVNSFLGLPWFVAATVLALTHINSLKVMSENTAPGERPIFMGVREQRVSTLVMSILIGLSVFLTQILSYIPMCVLYGVFLFMGVAALKGLQFYERVLILFMPPKHQPDKPYLRHVSAKRVHLFTIIQVISTAGLYLIKYIDAVAITFPILVLATCGIRKLLDNVFTQRELFWLDDILPTKKNSHNKFHDKHNLANGKDGCKLIDKGSDSEENFNQNKSLEKESMLKSNEFYLSSSTNSNSFLDEHDLHEYNTNNHHHPHHHNHHHHHQHQQHQQANQIPKVSIADENNNSASNSKDLDGNQTKVHTDRNSLYPPVRFVTHFSHIKEDDDKA